MVNLTSDLHNKIRQVTCLTLSNSLRWLTSGFETSWNLLSFALHPTQQTSPPSRRGMPGATGWGQKDSWADSSLAQGLTCGPLKNSLNSNRCADCKLMGLRIIQPPKIKSFNPSETNKSFKNTRGEERCSSLLSRRCSLHLRKTLRSTDNQHYPTNCLLDPGERIPPPELICIKTLQALVSSP